MHPDYRWLVETLSAAARAVVPGAALAWKWAGEDLVPGLSDLDARVICPAATPEEWARLDERLGEEHRRMLLERPHLARLLEHTPGMEVTAAELTDPRRRHPEFSSWSFAGGAEERATMGPPSWSDRDDGYYLRRFAAYLSPYDRELDPPINVPEARRPQYPYHSRSMHYLAPALHAAACLRERAAFPGKRAALRYWREVWPDDAVLRRVEHWLESGYPAVAADWDALDQAFYATLANSAGVVAATRGMATGGDPAAAIREAAAALAPDPARTLLEGVWYARIRAGRFRVYLDPPAGFEAEWLRENEARLVRALMTGSVWHAYATLRGVDAPPAELPDRLRGGVLDEEAAAAAAQVLALARAELGSRELLIHLLLYWPAYSRALEALARDVFGE